MSLPFYKFVPITGSVVAPAFTTEKKHALLATTNPLISSGDKYLVYSGMSALTNFAADLGAAGADYQFAQKYFGFLSKSGYGVQKLLVARWYKEAAAAFVKGSKPEPVATLKAVSNGSFGITLDNQQFEVVVDFSSITSYSDAATVIQTAIRANSGGGEAYTAATVDYNTTVNAFIINSGSTGQQSSVGTVTAGITGTDVSAMLGLSGAILSQGANAETFAEFCDRMLQANSGAFSVTTNEELDEDSITAAVAWLQGVLGGEQTIYTLNHLVFNISDLETAKALQSSLSSLSYTGYVVCYDPNNELVHALDCAICAAIDFNVANGAINFNFQPATGYTPITTLGTVIDYQQGKTNMSLAEELDSLCISYIYSVGFGDQEQVLYGMGLMQGDFGTEDVQVNESWLENDLQTRIMNGFISLEKLKLQGTDARDFMASIIAPSFEQGQTNGAIAYNGTLSDTDRNSIVTATGNSAAADSVADNGYYYQIQELTAEDIAAHRVRILACYLCGGVVNKVVITNRIYGA